jgi:hypothetical protein
MQKTKRPLVQPPRTSTAPDTMNSSASMMDNSNSEAADLLVKFLHALKQQGPIPCSPDYDIINQHLTARHPAKRK